MLLKLEMKLRALARMIANPIVGRYWLYRQNRSNVTVEQFLRGRLPIEVAAKEVVDSWVLKLKLTKQPKNVVDQQLSDDCMNTAIDMLTEAKRQFEANQILSPMQAAVVMRIPNNREQAEGLSNDLPTNIDPRTWH